MASLHSDGDSLKDLNLPNLECATVVLRHEHEEALGMLWGISLDPVLSVYEKMEAILKKWPVLVSGKKLKESFDAKYIYGVKLRLVYLEQGSLVSRSPPLMSCGVQLTIGTDFLS
jgi:hypothetical protein